MYSATSRATGGAHCCKIRSDFVNPPTPVEAVPINDHLVGSTPSLVEIIFSRERNTKHLKND